MRAMIGVAMFIVAFPTFADESSTFPAADAGTTIDRGLAFLAKDALLWKKDYECASCHHASLVAWSMREAKQKGASVDEAVLAEMTSWVADSGDGTTSVPRPPNLPKALNTKAVYFALALGADANPDAASLAGLGRLLETVKKDQTENGSWNSWPDTRPPVFGKSDDTVTANAVLSLLPAVNAGDESAKAVVEKGVNWLSETKTDDDPQSVAMRLVLWKRLKRPDAECQPLIDRIKERQNADGGWSQAADMASDGWATGQALYALSAAKLPGDDPAIARARKFLIDTQREDGSWPMTSRPTTPGGSGSNSLVPITGAGSAWAVLGLVQYR